MTNWWIFWDFSEKSESTGFQNHQNHQFTTGWKGETTTTIEALASQMRHNMPHRQGRSARRHQTPCVAVWWSICQSQKTGANGPRDYRSNTKNWHHPRHVMRCQRIVAVRQVCWWGVKYPELSRVYHMDHFMAHFVSMEKQHTVFKNYIWHMEFPKSWVYPRYLTSYWSLSMEKPMVWGSHIFGNLHIFGAKCHLCAYTTKFSDRETRHRKSPHLTSQEWMAMDQNPGALPEIAGIAGYVYIV